MSYQPLSSHESSSSTLTWEDVKKQARKLETLLYSKLLDYQAIIQTNTSSSTITSTTSSSSSINSSTVLGGDDQEIKQLEDDLNGELSNLSRLCDDLSTLIAESNVPDRQSASYTLQRYQGIYAEYTAEYRRHREKRMRELTRKQLLQHSNTHASSSSSSSSTNNSTNHLLREKSGLHSSLRMTDDLLDQALYTQSSLQKQHTMLQDAQQRLKGLGQKYPVINKLMSRITILKHRDNIILAAVIAGCIVFILWYMFNK
jgi:Golgi SNAP receptor complex protein 1